MSEKYLHCSMLFRPSIQTTKHWLWHLIPAAIFCDVYVHVRVHALQVCVQGTMERKDQQLCGFSDPEPGSQSVPGRSKVHQVLLQALRHICKFSDKGGFVGLLFFGLFWGVGVVFDVTIWQLIDWFLYVYAKLLFSNCQVSEEFPVVKYYRKLCMVVIQVLQWCWC